MSVPDDDPTAIARLLRSRLAGSELDLPVAGASMLGVIETGSTVHLVEAGAPRQGEIWAFVDDGGRVTVHRIRELGDATVTGRGSGNPADDPPVGLDRLVGRVTHAVSAEGVRRDFGGVDRWRAATAFRLRRAARGLRRRRGGR